MYRVVLFIIERSSPMFTSTNFCSRSMRLIAVALATSRGCFGGSLRQTLTVHRIGCGIANKQNERKSPPPPPGPDRRYYCGFRTATVRDLPVFGDGYSLRLILDGENGEPAHVDIALVVHEKDRSARATIKVDAGLAIAEAFGAAVEHICSSDAGDAHHPLIQFPDCLKGVGGSRLLSMQ